MFRVALSGVTRTKQRAVAGPSVAGAVPKATPTAFKSCANRRPSSSSRTLPTKPTLAPSAARSADGALVVSRDGTEAAPAFPVEAVVDTTGAGDLFAAGFLAGLSRGLEARDCARLGALAAAEVIGHLGARPQTGQG